jgi:DNA polymerase III subunit alpha
MPKRTFVHLQTYSQHSFPRGVSSVGCLLETAKSQGCQALALTDFGSLKGSIQLFREARRLEMRAIPGMTITLSEDVGSRIILLAKDEAGYLNLLGLLRCTRWHKPGELSMSQLNGRQQGLFAIYDVTSGGTGRALQGEEDRRSVDFLWQLENAFERGSFHLGCNAQLLQKETARENLVSLVGQSGLPLVALGDVRFALPEEEMLHLEGNALVNFNSLSPQDREVLLAMPEASENIFAQAGKDSLTPGLMQPPERMEELFSGFISAIDNTNRIAQQCKFVFPIERSRAPVLNLSRGYTPDSYLWDLVNRLAEKRYGALSEAIKTRLYEEYQYISRHQLCEPLLILHDLIQSLYGNWPVLRFADHHLTTSSIAFLLGLNLLDPVAYRIPFDANEPESNAAGKHIKLATPYGDFSRFHAHLAARFSIEHVGRAMVRYPAPHKDITQTLNWLRRVYHTGREGRDEDRLRQLMSESGPGGNSLLVSRDSLLYSIPTRGQNESPEAPLSVLLPEEDLESLNMMLLSGAPDLLCSLLSRALEMLPPARRKESFTLEDPSHFEMMRSWPWLPSSLVLDMLAIREKEILPLLWLVAPRDLWGLAFVLVMLHWQGRDRAFFGRLVEGAQKAGQTGGVRQPDRWERKLVDSSSVGERLLAILQPTGRCLLFFEQAVELVGIARSLSQEDSRLWLEHLLEDSGGKIERASLLENLEQEGKNEAEIEALNTHLGEVAPTLLSRECYLLLAGGVLSLAAIRQAEPLAFACALLSRASLPTSEKQAILEELRDRGIDVLPPDINLSEALATAQDGVLRLGLLDVLQVGEKICCAILEERTKEPFSSFFDFCERMDRRLVNQRVVLNLVLSGAFDNFGRNRAELLESIDMVEAQADRPSLFDNPDQLFLTPMEEEPPPPFLDGLVSEEFSPEALLESERERLGFPLSTHLLADYDDIFSRMDLADMEHPEHYDEREILALGYLNHIVDLSLLGRPLVAGIFFDGKRRFTFLATPSLLSHSLDGVFMIRALLSNLGHEPACCTARGCLKLLGIEPVTDIRSRLDKSPFLELIPSGQVDWGRIETTLKRFEMIRELPQGCLLRLPSELERQRGARRLISMTFVPTVLLPESLARFDFIESARFVDESGNVVG